MNIAFNEIIRDGVITLPAHLKSQVEGHSAHVIIIDQEPSSQAEDLGWDDIIGRLVRKPLPPFTPLSREEANERRP